MGDVERYTFVDRSELDACECDVEKSPDGEFVRYTQHTADQERIAELEEALSKINDIRNSIVGLQTINWSEHIYPLVAALDDAGCKGMSWPEGKEHFGTMLERTNAAESELAKLKKLLSEGADSLTEWLNYIQGHTSPGPVAEGRKLISKMKKSSEGKS